MKEEIIGPVRYVTTPGSRFKCLDFASYMSGTSERKIISVWVETEDNYHMLRNHEGYEPELNSQDGDNHILHRETFLDEQIVIGQPFRFYDKDGIERSTAIVKDIICLHEPDPDFDTTDIEHVDVLANLLKKGQSSKFPNLKVDGISVVRI
jgi:glutaredoxin